MRAQSRQPAGVFLLAAMLSLAGCAPRMHAEHSAALAEVMNPNLTISQRISAARDLGSTGNPETAVALSSMLPGDADALTVAVIDAMGATGDERALPRLEWMQNASGFTWPGKFYVALDSAISSIRNRLHQQGKAKPGTRMLLPPKNSDLEELLKEITNDRRLLRSP